MNIFQMQLKVDNKRMVDLHNEFVDRGEFEYLGRVNEGALPEKVSVEEFLSTQTKAPQRPVETARRTRA